MYQLGANSSRFQPMRQSSSLMQTVCAICSSRTDPRGKRVPDNTHMLLRIYVTILCKQHTQLAQQNSRFASTTNRMMYAHDDDRTHVITTRHRRRLPWVQIFPLHQQGNCSLKAATVRLLFIQVPLKLRPIYFVRSPPPHGLQQLYVAAVCPVQSSIIPTPPPRKPSLHWHAWLLPKKD